MQEDFNQLMTEQQNMNSLHIDEMNTNDILNVINNEDQKVAIAVQKELDMISQAVDAIYEKLIQGGRLFYVGAGTSGRLGVLDAAECPPTFNADKELVQGIIAGGDKALINAVEGVEDSSEQGRQDLKKYHFNDQDIVCGIAASGRTPYVIGALQYAKTIGASTVSLCCVRNGKISQYADYPIEVKVGPEVITGSTRMKAGTAQKMVLNMLSTATMIKLGKVYQNLMIDVQPTNVKLKERALHIIMKCTGVDKEKAKELLKKSHNDVKIAVLMYKTSFDFHQCQELLLKHQNNVASIIRQYEKGE